MHWICSRPYIAHAIGVVSIFLKIPRKEHWKALKWILSYHRERSNEFLCFGASNPVMKSYTDFDMVGDLDKGKPLQDIVLLFL